MVKVSVIIPMYNVEKYLRKCLDSVAYQTLKDIEVILVNDGSTDRTMEIAKGYINRIPNLKLLESENMGPGSARNIALDIATGEYIKFLDADDALTENDTLQIMYERASENDADVLIGTYNPHFGPINIKPAYHTLGVEKEGIVDLDANPDYPFKEMPSVGDKLFKREHIGTLRFPFTQWEDLPFVPLLMADSKRMYFLNRDVCNYRMRLNNTSLGGCFFAHDIFEFFKVYEHIREGFKERGLDGKYQDELLGLLAMHGSFDASTALFWINASPKEKNKIISYFIVKIEEIYPGFSRDKILLDYYKKHPVFKKLFDFCCYLSRRTFSKMTVHAGDIDPLIEKLYEDSKVLTKRQ